MRSQVEGRTCFIKRFDIKFISHQQVPASRHNAPQGVLPHSGTPNLGAWQGKGRMCSCRGRGLNIFFNDIHTICPDNIYFICICIYIYIHIHIHTQYSRLGHVLSSNMYIYIYTHTCLQYLVVPRNISMSVPIPGGPSSSWAHTTCCRWPERQHGESMQWSACWPCWWVLFPGGVRGSCCVVAGCGWRSSEIMIIMHVPPHFSDIVCDITWTKLKSTTEHVGLFKHV